MKGHVVWFAIVICVGDVMDCAYSHRHLTDGVDDGEVDDSPEEEDSAERKLVFLQTINKKRKIIFSLREIITQKAAFVIIWLLLVC